LYASPCEANSTRQFGDMPIKIPPVPPSFFGANGMYARREPLTYNYSISLQAVNDGGTKVSCELPILISALPPTRKAITAAQSMTMSTAPLTNPGDITKNAVLDDRPCETVEEKTGLEDGLTLTPVVDTSGNAYNGNIYSHTEDSGGSSQGVIQYQPLVSVFPSAPPLEGDVGVPPSTQEPTTSDNVGHDEAFNDLLSRMADELDARLAVDAWIKENPSATAELSPEEFAIILKKVLYSYDQASVARELVVGRGSVTVDHVLATMEACPFSKADLAKTMAPYVSDPENKESILSQLYSFEKDDVSKMFVR